MDLKPHHTYTEIRYNLKQPAFIEPEFFELKDKASKYLRITNDYYRGIWRFQENKVKTQFDIYVTRIFNQTSESCYFKMGRSESLYSKTNFYKYHKEIGNI